MCSNTTFAFFISKAPIHYYQEMEHYYQNPRPEMLAGILKVFGESGILANAKKRMLIAAFLAQLVKPSQSDLKILAGDADKMPDIKATLAWIAHLAGYSPTDVASILDHSNKVLLEQILATPSDLRDWNPEGEEAIVDMYMGAFMATGNRYWVEALLTAALHFASSGKNKVGRYAAAILYEYLPRHKIIAQIIRERNIGINPSHKSMIEQLLQNESK